MHSLRLRSTLSHTWDSAVVSGSTHIRTSGVNFQKPRKSAMKTKSSISRLSRALVGATLVAGLCSVIPPERRQSLVMAYRASAIRVSAIPRRRTSRRASCGGTTGPGGPTCGSPAAGGTSTGWAAARRRGWTGTNFPIVPNGGDVTIAWDNGSNKIFRLDRGRADVLA